MGILIKKLVFSVGKKKCKATESQKEPLNIIILQNNVCDSNHDLPKMLSKIGLEKKKSGFWQEKTDHKCDTRRLAPSLECDEYLKASPYLHQLIHCC